MPLNALATLTKRTHSNALATLTKCIEPRRVVESGVCAISKVFKLSRISTHL